ncbi:hypothetical protein GSM42_03650 [Shimazuella sp. KC615]|uniref:VWFA domain-containing protein n=1 Tax=Shimazuella alba TaxID=2690964 RepID=A0A6I4VMG2_9BACL|nr:hypothetical protein [Shimazuella alba]
MEPSESKIRRAGRYIGMKGLDQHDIDFVLDTLAFASGAKTSIFLKEREREIADFIERFPLDRVPGRSNMMKAVRALKLYKAAKHYIEVYERYYLDIVVYLIGLMELPPIDAQGMALLLRLAGGDEDGEDNQTQMAMEIAASQGIDLKKMLEIARQLDETDAFQSPQGELTPDPNGEDIRVRSIKEMSELPRISQQSWGLPDSLLMYKAFTGDLDVRDPVTRHDKKQLLYMLVDGTGSMEGDPVSRAVGVAINALERVIKGEAEVYLRFFDGELREQEYHADTPEAARELLQVVTDPENYQGSWTRFIEPLRTASERVNDLVREGKFRFPEIVMVTDGAAQIPDVTDLNGTKLNAVQVGPRLVEGLAKLAEASGGVNIDATERSDN